MMGPLCYGMIRFRCWMCKGHPTLGTYYSLGSCIWFVYGALMKQGSVLKPMAGMANKNKIHFQGNKAFKNIIIFVKIPLEYYLRLGGYS